MSRKKADERTSIPCPFVVLADKNELLPHHDGYRFEGIESNADTGYLPYDVTVKPFNLEHLGDYSAEFPDLGPWEQPWIIVERKSKADLFQSVTKRENFEWRLSRLNAEVEFAVVVVEAEISEILSDPPPHTEQTPTVVLRSIMSWKQRFRRVHWWFAPGREAGEVSTFRFLYRFYENLKGHKLNRDFALASHKAYLEGMQAKRKSVKTTECPYERKNAPGTLHDHWMRGYLDMQGLIDNKPIGIPSERPPYEVDDIPF